jgi:hypothetical protein
VGFRMNCLAKRHGGGGRHTCIMTAFVEGDVVFASYATALVACSGGELSELKDRGLIRV